MNKVALIGRLTRDPEVKQGEVLVAKYSLAVNRDYSREKKADFINCVAFGKTAEFASNYLHKGMLIGVTGRIQTGSYTNKDGNKVYTTDVVIESQEFLEPKHTEEFSPAADVELPFS